MTPADKCAEAIKDAFLQFHSSLWVEEDGNGLGLLDILPENPKTGGIWPELYGEIVEGVVDDAMPAIAQAITDAVAAQKEKDALVAENRARHLLACVPKTDLVAKRSANVRAWAMQEAAKAIMEAK